MPDMLRELFETSRFVPRWQCGNWTSFEGWMLILSDLAIFGAYAAIPFSIALYVTTKRREVVFPKLYWLFAAFILSCGFTHLLEAVIFWSPVYNLAALMKAVTAVVSWATVVGLIGILPTALTLPGAARLNVELAKEVEERRRSENHLKDLSTRLSLALAHSHLGDWVWETADDRVELSTRAAQIFDVPEGEKLRWTELLKRLHPEDREATRRAVELASAEKKDYAAVYRVVRNDGSIAWISARGRAEYNTAGQPWRMVGTVEDITARKLIELDRERLLEAEQSAREQAERANRVKDEFLATLSHELRTPLNAIAGWTHILTTRDNDPSLVRNGLEVIARNAKAQVQLVEDLLDMNGILTGKIRLEMAVLDLRSVAAVAVDSMRPEAAARDLEIDIEAPPNPIPVLGDAARLQQVLWNMLSNAVKFSSAGGSVRVHLVNQDPWVTLTVEDQGVGISPEFLPKVFDRFVQEDSSVSRSFRGLGLGLAIAKNLIDLHKGTLDAYSAGPGQGSTFTIRLPLVAATHHDRSSEEPEIPGSSELLGFSILAVDDEPDALSLTAEILRQAGAHVTTAPNARTALALAGSEKFDLLVSDIGMPVTDGYGLLKELRLLPGFESILAVALTAFVRDEDRAKAKAAGFACFQAKPVDPRDLISTIASLARHSGKDGETASG